MPLASSTKDVPSDSYYIQQKNKESAYMYTAQVSQSYRLVKNIFLRLISRD